MEYEIVKYLITHKDGIIKDIKSIATQAKDNPILRSFFEEAVTNEIILAVADGLNLSYEDVALVLSRDKIVELVGNEPYDI